MISCASTLRGAWLSKFFTLFSVLRQVFDLLVRNFPPEGASKCVRFIKYLEFSPFLTKSSNPFVIKVGNFVLQAPGESSKNLINAEF